MWLCVMWERYRGGGHGRQGNGCWLNQIFTMVISVWPNNGWEKLLGRFSTFNCKRTISIFAWSIKIVLRLPPNTWVYCRDEAKREHKRYPVLCLHMLLYCAWSSSFLSPICLIRQRTKATLHQVLGPLWNTANYNTFLTRVPSCLLYTHPVGQ